MPEDRPTPAPLSRLRRLEVLAVCCVAALVVLIDSTAVNLALPSISRDLHASTSQLQWVVDAYLLVLASLLMFSGALADRIGRRRILFTGLIIFGIGSALCSLSVSPEMLIAMRALQAVGGSMLAPVALSIITNTFTDPHERAQAIGWWGAVVGIGMATGPILGGALVSAIDWRAVFWINLPVVAIALPLVLHIVPESKSATRRGIDGWGQVLMIALLASLTFAIIEGGERGFASTEVMVAAALAAVFLVGFALVERRVREPLLEFKFFRSIPFALATVSALLAFFSSASFIFVGSLYLQDARGMAPLVAGFATLPMALAQAGLAPISGRLVGSRGTRLPMVLGSAALLLGGVLLTLLRPGSSLLLFIAAAFCVGSSLGLANSAITNIAVTGMPLSRAGVAGATASTARQLGQSLGVAVLGASLNSRLNAGEEFAAAAYPGWWVLIAIAVVLGVLSVLSGTRRALESAERVHATFDAR